MKMAGGILLLLAALGLQDKKERGKTPELTKKFVEQMEASSAEMKGLAADIEAGKPEADLKKRLARIREHNGKAREVRYRKDDEEAELLDGHFDIFELKLKSDFEAATWDTKEVRLNLLARLKAKCNVCHEECRK